MRGDAYEQTYLVLAGLFIAALVACNLIFQKFFMVEIPLPGGGTHVFRQSVGIIAYPLTFLVTDVLSEIYGARRANQVVLAGLVASIFTTGLVELADLAPSAEFGIGSETFHGVFGLSKVAVFASMMAYLTAQFIDIRLFHFWKRVTMGKHLWLRNNASTITSQLVDTFVVLALLASFSAAGITWENLPKLFLDGLLFKWTIALLDTPLFYLAVRALERRFPEQVAALAQEA
ncbi:Inner membrane protein YhhQ [Enhygromyxa salina]|uniref:Probable queuosine precursor transporter n=2 Tax=Enhygromyxa salina TaxID=215803 RepID=A0A2S9YVY3_9BACT|nr:Inner membrane protein YhhQ [Enhygromyxa salina]